MNGEPVKVFDAANGIEAELLRAALVAADVDATIDTTPSPLDGLTAMGQGVPVFVGADDVDRAIEIIDEAMTEHDDGDAGDEE